MRLPALLAAGLALSGCSKCSSDAPAPAADGSAEASDASTPDTFGAAVATGLPFEKVVAAVNPKHQAPYTGPKGTLRGTIRIDGDDPPESGLKFGKQCTDAEATYGKLFRVGLDHALADTIVAVTGYGDRGYVPQTEESVKVAIHHCATAKRTYAVTFGQRLDASNLDPSASYMPFLDGTTYQTIMVAIPKGAPVKLYPTQAPRLYMLRDKLESGLVAHVFVVNYATHDVTGLDGQYEIKNIPVGRVRVDVMLPVIDKTAGEDVDIKEGDNTWNYTLHFDAASDLPKKVTGRDGGAPPSAQPDGGAKRVRFQ